MDIFDEIIVTLSDKADIVNDLLGNGGASDYSHYRELVGQRRGYEEAAGIVRDIRKARMHDN